MRYALHTEGAVFGVPAWDVPLLGCLAVGGVVLLIDLVVKLARREFGSDLLAGISIVTSVLLGEYLAGTLVVLMLSGGEALEAYAVAQRLVGARGAGPPHAVAARIARPDGALADVPLDAGRRRRRCSSSSRTRSARSTALVVEGHGVMDESYLTGEPYMMSKTPGSAVLSGAINGESALTIRADKLAVDSRYAKIMQVMRDSEQRRPRLRRLGDQLGAFYTPLALVHRGGRVGRQRRPGALPGRAGRGHALSAADRHPGGDHRLDLAGGAARHHHQGSGGARDRSTRCRTAIFDKTGTLTYGAAAADRRRAGAPASTPTTCSSLAASLERYSKHPLALAVVEAAAKAAVPRARGGARSASSPGEGLHGRGRAAARCRSPAARMRPRAPPGIARLLPPRRGRPGVRGAHRRPLRRRCCASATSRAAKGRRSSATCGPQHGFDRVMLVSGDRESEVRYLAKQVGIPEVYAGQSPEQKLALVRETHGEGADDVPGRRHQRRAGADGGHGRASPSARTATSRPRRPAR